MSLSYLRGATGVVVYWLLLSGFSMFRGFQMAGLFKVDLRTDFGEFGNEAHNVFGYFSTLTVVDEINALMDAVEDQLIPLIGEVLCETAEITQQEVEELNGSGYGIRTYTGAYPGTQAAPQAPPFDAWSFKIVKSVVGTRSGGKRFGPIAMGNYQDRTPSPGALVNLNLLAAQLAAPLMVGLVQTWFPVILERPVAPSTVWGQHGVGGAVFASISTQNTRKR